MKTVIDADSRIQSCLARYSDVVVRIAFQNVKSRAEAEDIAQEVFLRLFTLGPDFTSAEHEKAWIIRVTINLCKDYLKSSWFRRRAVLEDNLLSRDGNGEVLDAVMRLDPKFRNVIYLHYYEDMSVTEIASALQQKENTVSSWLHRARKQLKKSLTGGFDDE
ncbi:sigma-70 family RNA polymerase sigma factor [Clostridium sp. KNHs216]|uniref:sigma-70 family RNA polymerase sigma factor n=1 Tax=Clostridium sp. KNHs216 TaxID=1550235 RepID=UPI00114F59AC|nr:sigma-70 family RNA polymerase sigma factor [Clostridium sp. KNHs216]TQI67922.1 RNA polymerase sigma-70 factor (ECF subfamily) [Clostridium sp. KNHs216]